MKIPYRALDRLAAESWARLARVLREEGCGIEFVLHDEITIAGPPEALERVRARLLGEALDDVWSKTPTFEEPKT